MILRKSTAALALLNVLLLAVIGRQAYLLHEQRGEVAPVAGRGANFADGSSSSSSFTDPSDDDSASDDNHNAKSLQADHGVVPLSLAESDAEKELPQFNWQQVESDDYLTYIDNLHSIGCPEQTVKDIVTADVMAAFAAKRASVMAEGLRDFKYWKSDVDQKATRGELERRQREVDEWMSSTLREFLGPDVTTPPTESEWRQATLAEQLSFLQPDIYEEVLAQLGQYADVDSEIRALSSNRRALENPDERLRAIEAYHRKREALHALLTPEEYEFVDMTVSWTADNLRRAMTKFEPTEEEFRIIFREWRIHDENLAVLYANGQPDPGNAHVFENISKFLSPDRYQLYRETWWK